MCTKENKIHIMKKTHLVIVLLFSILYASSQESEIKKIREIYNDYNNKIELQGEDSNPELPMKFVIQSTVTERGVGPVARTMTMYFDRTEKDDNSFTYTDKLRKLIIIEEASFRYYTEMLFDDNEKLMFCYVHYTGFFETCSEKRFYFKNDELIRVVFNKNKDAQIIEEDEEPCNEGTRDLEKLTHEDKKLAGFIKRTAENYKKAFQYLVDPY